ncbi:sensor histidine kinase [Microtetraspora niveoalba]|uniref:sensor histidine kinase n=1 Tax=Microtetraspora niveoalba TaxID=46175 RepID=UPI001FE1F3A2|nr:HAMP domain-containing sensor histidine kinase [Microtetraspora niveoalba]
MRPVAEVKRRLARTPLWLRLVGATLLLVTLAIALTGGFAVQLLRGYLIDRVDRQLTGFTRPRSDPQGGQDRDTTTPGGTRPQRQPGFYYIVLLDADGNAVRTVQEPPNVDPPVLPRLTAAVTERMRRRLFTASSPSGEQWRVVAVGEADGVTRVVAVSLADVDGTVSQLVVIVAGVGFGVLVALGLACYWLVRRSLRPLGEIERTAQAIAGGDLSRRLPLRHRRTEIGRLGRAINGMLAQIESAFRDREESEAMARESAFEARRSEERMRRFVADASHELRTPLTSIRGFAELYRQERSQDPAAVLRRIEDEAARMGLLVDDLLLLARLDQQRPLQRRAVDVLSLAAGAVLDAQTLAPDREIDLVRLDGSDAPVKALGDEHRIRQVIGNLVGNVLRHTPPGTAFRVGVGTLSGDGPGDGPGGGSDGGSGGGGTVVIEVADEGPGLREDDVERVFERFYRADPARSRADTGGTGLGLSIVAALVKAHGGTITAESPPGGGAVFQVRLPAC